MAMKVISNVQKKTGIVFLILGLISILIYFMLLLPYQTSNNDISSFIFITGFLLGFGISFILISIYIGFTPQELTLYDDYILYKHWIQTRKIPINKIRKLRALGIKSENAKMWALVIESENRMINAASDFDKQKLSEIFDKIANFQDKFKFKIEIKD